jgi:hypothetical protein
LRLPLALVALLGLSACQAVFGDFTIAPISEETEVFAVCRHEEYRCVGPELEVCAPDRSGFVPFRSCEAPSVCHLGTASCKVCTPGEVECHGQTIVQCAPDATWATMRECTDDTRCEVAAGAGSCEQRACSPGQLTCEGTYLLACSPEGEREVADLCATGELCIQSLAQTLSSETPRARCNAPVCEAGETRCEGAVLSLCTFARDGFEELETCATPELCNPVAGDCSPCTPDEVHCSGALLLRCSAAAAWETLRTCESPALCDAAKVTCNKTECDSPGVFRCGADNGLEVCSPGRTWEVTEACVTTGLCSASAGRCREPACRSPEQRCVGNEWQRCAPDLSRFERRALCRADQMCDPMQGCVAAGCTDGQVRCNGIYLERCAGGAFERAMRCETPELCDAVEAVCHPPGCGGDGEKFQCIEQLLQECPLDRIGWLDRLPACASSQICDAGYAGLGPGHCDNCVPGDFACEGNSLVRCAADGRTAPVVANCANGCDDAAQRCL